MGKRGAPKYDEWLKPENLIRIRGWAMDGLTLKQIAKNMGIATSTLCVWKEKFKELSETLKISKEVADRQVENALFKSAIGYRDPDGVYHPPNTTSQIFWLKNRKPKQWRDRIVEVDNEELTRAKEILQGVGSVIDNDKQKTE